MTCIECGKELDLVFEDWSERKYCEKCFEEWVKGQLWHPQDFAELIGWRVFEIRRNNG